MKFAYFVHPHLGGTYSVYVSLRAGLGRHGHDVRWVGVGSEPAAPSQDSLYAEALNHGCLVAPGETGAEGSHAVTLIEALERERFDGVFINVLAEQMQMNIARYLPAHIRRIMIVHTITPATYAAASAIRNHVHATVAVCERARRDLIKRHGFAPRWIRTINNAIDVDAMGAIARSPSARGRLKLLYLGRIEDIAKGVFWLPEIMERVATSTTLTVAGDGPDRAELQKRLARFGGRVEFLGGVPHERVPGLLADHDALLMPSRFEGSPVTLMEAMAGGCVPLASRISAVTDQIVEHGVSGLLFPIGGASQAAREIARLETEPLLLRELSVNARLRAKANFGIESMADAYAALISEICREGRQVAVPLPVDHWAVPAGFRPGLRAYVPQPVKNWLRVALERL